MVCDFDYNVVRIRPECQSKAALTYSPINIAQFGEELADELFDTQEEGSGFAENSQQQSNLKDIFMQIATSVNGVKSSLTEEVTKGRSNYEINDLATSYFNSETAGLNNIINSLTNISQEFTKSGELSRASVQQLKQLLVNVKLQRSSLAQKLSNGKSTGRISGNALGNLIQVLEILETEEKEIEKLIFTAQASQETEQIAENLGQNVIDETGQISGVSKPEKLAVKPSKEGEECSDTANAVPHQAHETDCSMFYHCVPNHGLGSKLVLKSCSAGTLFNPKNLICDWPRNVYKVKPKCKTPGNILRQTIRSFISG